GTKFDIGRIDVLPLGTFNLKGSLSFPAGNTIQGGGTYPWHAPSGVAVYASICSTDGYFTSFPIPSSLYFGGFNMTSSQCTATNCWTEGTQVGLAAPPLRDFIQVIPDTTGACFPGFPPQWPVNGPDAPVWENFTYVNLTAGHSLAAPNPVWVNF